jgi:hypothetical protein
MTGLETPGDIPVHIHNNYITPVISQNYIWHPTANKLCCLNCRYSVVCKSVRSKLIFVLLL